jgi:hypothetical protein
VDQKIIYIAAGLVCVLASLAMASATFAGGDGSSGDPYQITNWTALNATRLNMSAHYVLNNNLTNETSDYAGLGDDWEPIGHGSGTGYTAFTGSFDGQGYWIKNLSINKTDDRYIGLFAYLGVGSSISDLGISVESIIAERFAGSLAGTSRGNTNNINIIVNGNLHVELGYLGGMIGETMSYANIQNCSVTILGFLSRSYYMGGLIGASYEDVNISYSRVVLNGNALVAPSGGVGGFIGWSQANITDSYVIGGTILRQSSTETRQGGFVGYNRGPVTNCYSTTSIVYNATENPTDKGFAGGNDSGSAMSGNFWDMNTSGQTSTAGEATGKTTSQMKTLSTFTDAGWDIEFNSLYDRNDGYPYLSWEVPGNSPVWYMNGLFCGGNGTESNPYQICTWTQLNNTRLNMSAYYILNNNLTNETADYTGLGDDWEPIGHGAGTGYTAFTGSFDGQGYWITNISINKTDDTYIGLFANLGSDGEIFNLNIGVDDILAYSVCGGIVGRSYGTITNSSVSVFGTIYSDGHETGGLVGENRGNVIASSVIITGNVSAKENGVGGIVGNNNGNGNISNSSVIVSGVVSSLTGGYVGGFVGNIGSNAQILNSWVRVMGPISANAQCGGFVGSNSGTISKSSTTVYDNATVEAGADVGLIVGENAGTCTNTYGTIYDPSNGNITFLTWNVANSAGGNLLNSMQLGSNWAWVNGSISGYNQSANITLKDTGIIGTPIILKDGALCTDCTLLSSDGDDHTFNVTSWSNYTLSGTSPTITSLTIGNNTGSYATYNPTTCSTTSASILLNVTDDDGYADIQVTASDARTNCTLSNAAVDITLPCTLDSHNANWAVLECTGNMQYYHATGDWNAACTVYDGGGDSDSNSSQNLTYNRLESVDLSAASISWSGLTQSSEEVAALANPLEVLNCGNAYFASVNATAYNLTNGTDYMPASDFSVNVAAAAGGDTLSHDAPVTITSAALTIGSGAKEELYFYLESLSNTLPPGIYSGSSAWQIMVYDAANSNP